MKRAQYICCILFFLIGGKGIAQVNLIDTTNTTKVTVKSGYFEKKPEFPEAIIYTRDNSGQVYIVHEGVEMWCDQAFVYFKDNFVKAYGNVRITQGDTVSMQSKYGEYNGNTSFAFAAGEVVLTEPKTTLRTDTLYFDRIKQQAYYRSGGTVRDTASTLTSRIGRYYAESKKYQFLSQVKIVNPDYTLKAPQLDFYSESGVAYLYGKSTIESETSTVYCERGYYNTRSNTGYFVKNSRVDYNNRILYGDSIYFDRSRGFASATNNIKILDTLNKSIIKGHYAEVFRNQDSIFITKRALAITLQEQDSMYVHADTIRITGKPENRIIRAFYKARMFKRGTDSTQATSGKCDSIFVDENRGLTKLITRPILWSGENQMTGDTIHLINNKETDELDSLKVFKNAFLIQKDSLGYNQVTGERLIGLFTKNELDTVDLIKNTQVVYYSRNDKGELVGINNTVSSSIQMYLENQKIVGIRFIKKVPGKVYPPSEFPDNARILPGFEWRGEERLMKVEELFEGKPAPILPKIQGISLPEDEGAFFDDREIDSIALPKASKLKANDLKVREDDPKFETEKKMDSLLLDKGN